MERRENYQAKKRRQPSNKSLILMKSISGLTALFCASIAILPFSLWPVSLGAANISAVILILYSFISLLFVFYIFDSGKVHLPPVLAINMLIFLATILISLLGRANELQEITFIFRFIFLFSIPIILINNLNSRVKVENALHIVVLIISAIVLIGFARSITESHLFWTLTDVPKTRNLHAFIAEIGFLFAIGHVVCKSQNTWWPHFLIYLPAAVICGAAIVFSLSRGAWVATFTGISVPLLSGPSRKIIVRFSVFIIITILIGGSIVFLTPNLEPVKQQLLSRAETLSQLGSLPSDKYRLMYQLASLDQISAYPFRGIGAGRYGQVVDTGDYGIPAYVANVDLGNAHNSYFHIWAEQGLLGLLAFLFIVGWPLVKGLQRLGESKDWLTIGAVSFLISSVVHLGLEAFYRSFPFWIGYGLAIAAIIYSPRKKI